MVETPPVALEELKKLTVPQLKALCKERRVVGYSKLGKPAIIQKLIDLNNNNNGVSTAPTTVSSTADAPSLGTSDLAEAIASTPNGVAATEPQPPLRPAQQPVSSNGPTDNSPNLPTTTTNQPLSSAAKSTPDVTTNPKLATKGKKRAAPTSTALGSVQPPPKKLKTAQAPLTTSGIGMVSGSGPSSLTANASSSGIPKVSSSATSKVSPVLVTGSKNQENTLSTTAQTPLKALSQKPKTSQSTQRPTAGFKVPQLPASKVIPPIVSKPSHAVQSMELNGQSSKSLVNRVSSTMPSGKRFVPLTIKKPPTPSPKGPMNTVTSRPTNFNAAKISDPYSLAFPVSRCLVSLVPITRPPSLSQRKLVPRWSILLSGLGVSEIKQCTQVSRMFRYAVYLSAVQRLAQNFGGRRLAILVQEYPQNMTNMWPYFRFRELEVSSRKARYNQSFLGRFFESSNPISEHLWTSPDHERQITVAVRFLLTRLWFLVSIGGSPKDPTAWTRGVIVDAQELVKGEIWSITTRDSSYFPPKPETFYVLDSTCEVVGHPPSILDSEHSATSRSIPVRADWSAYIAHRLLPPSMHDFPPPSLIQHLKGTNYEEYDKGISKQWLLSVVDLRPYGGERKCPI